MFVDSCSEVIMFVHLYHLMGKICFLHVIRKAVHEIECESDFHVLDRCLVEALV